MKILVIIVTYNAKKWIDDCFGSIVKSTLPCDVFVVDNGSTDGTQSIIQTCYPSAHFVQSKCNLGFGKANNLGFKYAVENGYDFCYLLNQDAYFFPETLSTLINVYEKNCQYGILSPIQLQKNANKMDSNFQDVAISNRDFLNDLLNDDVKDVYSVQSVMAAHWLVPIKTIKTVGFFSPAFPHYGEDDNYCDRVEYHGMKVGFVPQARAVHDREFRKDTKKKILYLNYIHNIARLSFIQNPTAKPILQILKHSLKVCVEQKTLRGIFDLLLLLARYRKIKQYKEQSKEKCAFFKG